MAFVKKLLKAFDYKSSTLQLLKVLCPKAAQEAPLQTVDKLSQTFAIPFYVQKVRMELREFRLDSIHVEGEEDAKTFWLRVRSMKSPLGEPKYLNLADLALQLLAIPVSNADSERVFSLVRRIQTEFRSRMTVHTLSALISCHMNKNEHCCERTKFPQSLLSAAKKCTNEKNQG